MTPEELARIRAFLAKVRVIAEDFHKVFYNHLLAEAPELRIRYLPSVCQDAAGLCVGIAQLAEVADDPERLERALAGSRVLSGAGAQRVQELNFQVFFWTANRCLGAEFTAEDRAAFETLHGAITAALERLHGPSSPESFQAADIPDARIGI